jgi:hypothetical protein
MSRLSRPPGEKDVGQQILARRRRRVASRALDSTRRLTDALDPAELLGASGRGGGEGLDDLVNHVGPEAGDVVGQAGGEVRLDLRCWELATIK